MQKSAQNMSDYGKEEVAGVVFGGHVLRQFP